MKEFQYVAPASLDEAVSLLSKFRSNARMLAGGTDILVQLREGHVECDWVIDVKKISELMALEVSQQFGLQLGASVPCYRVYEHGELASLYPAIVDSARIIGGWQIQSRASIGGNLCNSSPAADCIPPLIVHQAVCHIASVDARRTSPVSQFCVGPGKNILEPNEILVALTVPPTPPNTGSAYQRFIPRNEMDIAVAGAASLVQLDDRGETIQKARIALGAIAPTPRIADEASEWLVGKPASHETFKQAGELAKRVAAPIDDMRGTAEYRTHLVGVLTKRTLEQACKRAKLEES